MSQDRQKTYADKSRRPSPNYKVNDLVWVKLHPLSKASQNRSVKLMPRRNGPYIVLSQRSSTIFVVASCGVYHTSALTPFLNGTGTLSPVVPLKKRGRSRKQPLISRGTARENAIRGLLVQHLVETVFGGVGQCYATPGPRTGTGPWIKYYWVAKKH
ncbi:gag-Pol polyprotein [Trichonephila clavipes]|uniref:Gag-Pol polyprotein n=1 Tax=Trichonephila clavipes TaxID=2585209 RepID=A0A8X6SLA2_TRICX|nr:gag-Pol polyprotein [Trichonephila clavipes]